MTHVFSGKSARGIRNRFIEMAEAKPDAILNFPWHDNLTRAMRSAAAKANQPEFLSLWARQAAGLARPLPAAMLVELLAKEAGLAT